MNETNADRIRKALNAVNLAHEELDKIKPKLTMGENSWLMLRLANVAEGAWKINLKIKMIEHAIETQNVARYGD